MKKFLHLHGIGSGSDSHTGQRLKRLFPQYQVFTPELPAYPFEAVNYIKKLCSENKFDFVTGMSLGGFYAMLIPDLTKFLINPAMFPDSDIPEKIGMGMHEFSCKRSDGIQVYNIDEKFVSELEYLRNLYYNRLYGEKYKSETYGFLGTEDELLSHIPDFKKYFPERHLLTGKFGHSISDDFLENHAVPFINSLMKNIESSEIL